MKYRVVEMMNGDFWVQFYVESTDSWHTDIDFSSSKPVPHKPFTSHNDAMAYINKIKEKTRRRRESMTIRTIHEEIEIDD